jgi:hypothetical protein
MRYKILTCLTCILLLAIAPRANAQTKPRTKPPATKPVAIAEQPGMPKLKTRWGTFVGGVLYQDDVIKFLDSALRVVDDRGIAYQVVKYVIMYKRKETTTDDATGQNKTFYDNVSFRHTTNPLPLAWRQSMKTTVKKGETITFTDILVRSKTGRQFIAPEIKIEIMQ